MDVSYLSNLSRDQYQKATSSLDRKKQFLPPSNKRQTSSQVTSSAVQLFLARKQYEERQKYEEFQKKKEELLLLRAQNSKNNKKAKLMASRTRDNDFSKIKLTEDEEEAKANREKEIKRKGLYNKVDRMKARIELEERDSQLPRKRKRKSHLSNNDEPLNDVNNINTDVKFEYKFNGSGVPIPVSGHQKKEPERKTVNNRPKPAPVMGYDDLLQVAAKKQYEPIVLPDEDFEEESDEYEEEDESHTNSAEKFTTESSGHYESLKKDKTISKKNNTSDENRTVEKAKLNNRFSDIHESRQNKENAYKNHNHSSYSQPHKQSAEHKKSADRNQSNKPLSQKHSLKNESTKEDQTTCNKENHSSKKIPHSNSSKHHSDSASRNNAADRRNINTSKEDNSVYTANASSREHLKKLQVQPQHRIKSQNQPNYSHSSSLNNSNSDQLTLKRKYEETFKSNIKTITDRKTNIQHDSSSVFKHSSDYSRDHEKEVISTAKHCLKKNNETNLRNNHSSFKEHKKVESSHSFRIPKKDGNKAASLEDNTPCYYTDGGSNSVEDVKHSNVEKISCPKVHNSPVLKSNKYSSVEKSQTYSSSNDNRMKVINKTNKSHINNVQEQIIKKKRTSDTSNDQNRIETKHTNQQFNGKFKEKIYHSKPAEDSSSNRSDKFSNSNEYFTEEGQGKVRRTVSAEIHLPKDKIKKRTEPALSSDVCQYFTEQFTDEESVNNGQSSDLKYHSSKKAHNSAEKEKSKIKHSHHFTEHSSTVNNQSSLSTSDIKHHKHEKTKISQHEKLKIKQPHYFTEHSVVSESNTRKAVEPNRKHEKSTNVHQKTKQMKHSQYFTEHFATDENNTKSNYSNCKNDRRTVVSQREKQMKQPQYFTENFVTDENKIRKNSDPNCKYNKRTALAQKERQVNQPQYFTEHFVSDDNTMKNGSSNCKYDKRIITPQKEKQMKQSQYFTEQFVSNEDNRTKTIDFSGKYDKNTTIPQKEKQMKHSQYFTEDFATEQSNTAKSSESKCKYDKRTTIPQKEKQITQPQYFTENFNTNQNNATRNNVSNYNYNKRTALSQKEKQMKNSQYFTEHFTTDESNTAKRSDLNSRYEKRATVPQKEKQMKHSQYFTESFTTDDNNFAKNNSHLDYKYEKNTTVPQTEKSKTKQLQNISEENVSKKVLNKGISRNASNSRYEIFNKMQKDDYVQPYIPEDIRKNSKRPNEQSEIIEYIPSKVCKYENPINNKVHVSNHSRKDKLSTDRSTEKSKFEGNKHITESTAREANEQSEVIEYIPSKVCKYENPISNKVHVSNHSRKDKLSTDRSTEKSKFEGNKHITESTARDAIKGRMGSKEKVSKAVGGQIHYTKALNNQRNSEKENTNSNLFSNTTLKEHREKHPSPEHISLKKPNKRPLHNETTDKEKLLHQSKSFSLKQALPTKTKKIIPASSMAQMMNKKSLQNTPLLDTVGAKAQNVNSESSKSKKLLQSSVDAKRTGNQMKSNNPPLSMGKFDSGKKQAYADAKSIVTHQKVNSSFQRHEKEMHIDHRKSHLADTHKNMVKKPVLGHDRKLKQDHYDSKNRNRFTRPSPRMFIKRNMESDDEEDDDDDEEDDMSDFIDDGPLEEDEEDYSRYIREIFGYDKRRYRFEEDLDDRDMETSYAQQMKEERRSARIGLLEDLEDMRKEEEEKKRKSKNGK